MNFSKLCPVRLPTYEQKFSDVVRMLKFPGERDATNELLRLSASEATADMEEVHRHIVLSQSALSLSLSLSLL